MWELKLSSEFDLWLKSLPRAHQDNLISIMMLLEKFGPTLSRPYVDSIHGSRISNLKELRIQSNGVPIRVLFAFNKYREGLILCGGNKKGNDKRFYKSLISQAEKIYNEISLGSNK